MEQKEKRQGRKGSDSPSVVTVMPASPTMGDWGQQVLGSDPQGSTSQPPYKGVAGTLMSRGCF